MSDGNGPRCLLSHPGHTHHSLSTEVNPVIRLGCFTCSGKYTVRHEDYVKYYCKTCGVEFHNGCHKRLRRITHPYHLQHPLTLFYRDPETGTVSNIIPDANPSEPDIYDEESDTSDQGQYQFVDIVPSRSDITFDKCTWCGKDFQGDWFYRCLICSFCLDLPCAEKAPPLTLANPKGHHHSLHFLPRPLLVPCDACGLVDASEPSYACLQCNYMSHQSCIDLPRVIKITRHPHRLHYIPYRSPMSSSCRICYKYVDVKYGQYSCNQEDCSYVVHSKCATHVNVWDGTDLEWEPEANETDEEDIASFKNLGNGLIDHFGHEHLLRLKKQDGVGDTVKKCDACVFPIVSPQFYHCGGCDYSLHEVCAGLPRKMDHALHNHTLFLDPSPPDNYAYMACSVCFRASTGFRYRCHKEGRCTRFWVDVSCISVQECFIHKSHEHHIFISTSYNSMDEIICKGCKKRCTGSHLHCTVCEYALCYPCGTIPDEIYYKYDKHPLTLSYGEKGSAGDIYWCEMCEKLLDPKEWFYTCDECCTTIHLQCIFGSSFFIKPGSIFGRHGGGFAEVFGNNSNTRLLCYSCNNRCTGSVYYEGYEKNGR
ncbi:Cysteine/Histidine-rich C1 domain family protein [Raphanus sativus]|nr:Cysteine/Histidine-rich C1 domain family protein [Raphanus sativus]